MPLSQPYYLNGSSLSNSTAIYLNSAMTIYAPDGWYSDGGVTRQLVSGVLQPLQLCPSCGVECGGTVGAGGGQGVYIMNINTGTLPTDVGAIIVRFNPLTVPDGIKAVFDGVTYNEVSSEDIGWLGGVPSGLPIFLGSATTQTGCPSGSIIGGPFALPTYAWNGTSFDPTGITENVTVLTSQDRSTSPIPGMCTLVIPKPTPSPAFIQVTCYGVCASTIFNVSVECPALLRKFKGSTVVADPPSGVCELPTNQNYYVANVNGTYPYLGLYDWVFSDPYGISVLPDGYYKTNNLVPPFDTIRVVNGVVDQIIDACS